MPYDSFKHHRRSIRLKEYDYSQVGAYFVTICAHNRECLFDAEKMRRIVEAQWCAIPKHFVGVDLDEWVVMPNHFHGIIVIADAQRKGEAFPADTLLGKRISREKVESKSKQALGNASPLPPNGVSSGSLGAIIGNFKSVTTRRINAERNTQGAPVWQRNYYEHIIRDEKELERIRTYILNNPANWEMDEENPKRIKEKTVQ